MNPVFEQLISNYHDWLKSRVMIADVNGVCEITTPFLDRHNDRLQIYVEQRGDGYRLSDDGYIISDLAASGCVLDTSHRKKLLHSIIRGFGVEVVDGEMFVDATERDFPRRKHLLIQAMLAVNDMFLTAKSRVANLFIEDVKAFFEENEIRYTPDVEFTGKSGFVHRFDCVIPGSKREPERLIRAINSPSRNEATSLLFAWTDTKTVRPANAMAYAIVNDEERQLSKDIEKSLQTYGVSVIPWKRREEFIPKLAA